MNTHTTDLALAVEYKENTMDPKYYKMNFFPKRFWGKVEFSSVNGCWLWVGSKNKKGYGRYHFKGKCLVPHRFVYEILVGKIPDNYMLDHFIMNVNKDLCSTSCCNPAHLEPVTRGENTRRGDHQQRRKTHCPNGHPYDKVNTYFHKDGSRECGVCRGTGIDYIKRSRILYGSIGGWVELQLQEK